MEQNGTEYVSVLEPDKFSGDVLFNGYGTALAITFGTIREPSPNQVEKSFKLAEIANEKLSTGDKDEKKIMLTKDMAKNIRENNIEDYELLMARYLNGLREVLVCENDDLIKSKEVVRLGKESAKKLFRCEHPIIDFVK